MKTLPLLVGSLFLLSTNAFGQNRLLRIVSAPDLINADIAHNEPRGFDLDETDPNYISRRQEIYDARDAAGLDRVPGYPEYSDGPYPGDLNGDGVMSIQEGYRGGMQHILEDIAARKPDLFIASGDIVDGEWAVRPDWDDRTLAEKQAQIWAQGDIYYGAYFQNLADAGYTGPFYAVIGDHEIGDNDWGSGKVQVVPTFYEVYQHHLDLPETVAGDGAYVDVPPGREGRWWAKQHGNVLMMGIETFDVRYDAWGEMTAIVTDGYQNTTKRTLISQDHLDWIEATLQQARNDSSIDYIFVMGHCPFDVPGVRKFSSSDLRIGGGTSSELWALFEQYDVTLYLAGEVHAVSGFKKNGVTQIVTSGNQFSPGTDSDYLTLDVYADRILLTLRKAEKLNLSFKAAAADPINDDGYKAVQWCSNGPYRVVGTATLYTGDSMPHLVEVTGSLATFIVDEDPLYTDPLPAFTPDPEPEPEYRAPTVPAPGVIKVLSSVVTSGSNHPGGALPLYPAHHSVLILGVTHQWDALHKPVEVMVEGQFYPLQLLGELSGSGNKITTAFYGAEIGPVQEKCVVTMGVTNWRVDGSEENPTLQISHLVQLDGATLEGLAVDALRSDQPSSLTINGRGENTFWMVVGGYNMEVNGLTLSGDLTQTGEVTSSRNGSYVAGNGFFDVSGTAYLNWTSADNYKGAAISALAINPIPKLHFSRSQASHEGHFSWPSVVGTGFRLESSTNLAPGSWTPVAGTPVEENGQFKMELPLGNNTEMFFRLATP